MWALSTPSSIKKAWLEAEWQNRTSTLKPAQCLAFRNPTAYGLCTNPLFHKFRGTRTAGLIPSRSKLGPTEEKSFAPGLWYLSLVSARSDFSLTHRVTHDATNPLDYSDGQQDCQGVLALKHSNVSIRGALGRFAEVAETAPSLPVTPESPQAWDCAQMWGTWAIGHFN